LLFSVRLLIATGIPNVLFMFTTRPAGSKVFGDGDGDSFCSWRWLWLTYCRGLLAVSVAAPLELRTAMLMTSRNIKEVTI